MLPALTGAHPSVVDVSLMFTPEAHSVIHNPDHRVDTHAPGIASQVGIQPQLGNDLSGGLGILLIILIILALTNRI